MSRDRLTITLDPELLTAIDATIDGSSVRNRSHAIEHVLRLGLEAHRLTTLVLVVDNTPAASLLPELLQKLAHVPLQMCALISLPEHPGWTQDMQLSISSLAPHLKIRVVPVDFGSGAALTLLADDLTGPFIIAQLDTATKLPASFLAFYTAHRQQGSLITQFLVTQNGQQFLASGCSIAEPELIAHIPAGRAQLSDVFSQMAEAGRVGTYVG
jgi:hypothetical protein